MSGLQSGPLFIDCQTTGNVGVWRQEETHALRQIALLFDHLIGAREHRRWDNEAERCGCASPPTAEVAINLSPHRRSPAASALPAPSDLRRQNCWQNRRGAAAGTRRCVCPEVPDAQQAHSAPARFDGRHRGDGDVRIGSKKPKSCCFKARSALAGTADIVRRDCKARRRSRSIDIRQKTDLSWWTKLICAVQS
jgi:hypothetical protein